MTRVELSRAGGRYSLRARGHAYGSPAVCAAASALIWALEGWLRGAEGAEVEEARLAPGDALLVWRGGAGSDEVFRLVETGLRQIAATRPTKIFVRRGEGRENGDYDGRRDKEASL